MFLRLTASDLLDVLDVSVCVSSRLIRVLLGARLRRGVGRRVRLRVLGGIMHRRGRTLRRDAKSVLEVLLVAARTEGGLN